jgi:hypothetical protein
VAIYGLNSASLFHVWRARVHDPAMASRLLHSLVFSSLMALEGLGCSASHADRGSPPRDDDWIGTGPPVDTRAGAAARHVIEAVASDARPDSAPDAGPEAGPDAESGADADIGWDAGDVRLCEPGWPTTKAVICMPIEPGVSECCRSLWTEDGGESRSNCCIGIEE